MRSLLAAALLAMLLPRHVRAQDEPRRPKLDSKADTNDWESYYDWGVEHLKARASKSQVAFYWANRLDPSRAEPIYGQWIAYWQLDLSEFDDYLRGRQRILDDPKVQAAEDFRTRALWRNPFVNRALLMVLIDQLPGRSSNDGITNALLDYANQRYADALSIFGQTIARDPARYAYLRFDRATVFAQIRRYDSAAVEMAQLLDEMRREDRKHLVYAYESKEMFEYALGLLDGAMGRLDSARAAQERALVETLAVAPAHAALAQIARAQRDTATAAREYAAAIELEPKDGTYRLQYGNALLAAGRVDEAVEQMRQAVRLEPYYAETYLGLASALQTRGDSAGAVAAYRDYLARAPRRASSEIDQARARLAALGAGGN